MAKRIKVEDDPDLGVGYARISITADGLPEGASQLYLKRKGYAKSELGASGWQSAEYAIQAERMEADGNRLVVVVGPAVVGYMETGNYGLEVGNSSSTPRFSGVLPWKNVTPCAPPGAGIGAGGSLDVQRAPVTDTAALVGDVEIHDTVAVEPVPELPTEPAVDEPAPDAPARRASRTILAIIGLLILLLVGGWLVWSHFKAGGDSQTSVSEPNEPNKANEPNEPHEPNEPEESKERKFHRPEWRQKSAVEQYEQGLVFVQESAGADDAAELIGHAEWLFDMAKDQGSATAALELARLYDPRELTPARAQQLPPDLNSAYRAYRQAQELGSAEAVVELCELKGLVEQLGNEGDSSASMLLRRPWPECGA